MAGYERKYALSHQQRPRPSKKLDALDLQILEAISTGGTFLTSTHNMDVRNALTRLRRNGHIQNLGSRSLPRWVIVETKTQDDLLKELDQGRRRIEALIAEKKDQINILLSELDTIEEQREVILRDAQEQQPSPQEGDEVD